MSAQGGVIPYAENDRVPIFLSPGKVFVETSSGWVEVGTTDRIEYRSDDPEWNAQVPMLRQYQGFLRFDMLADDRAFFTTWVDGFTGGPSRRSVMRTDYRAKTRRRNRRRR